MGLRTNKCDMEGRDWGVRVQQERIIADLFPWPIVGLRVHSTGIALERLFHFAKGNLWASDAL